jgi:hypothetical protein
VSADPEPRTPTASGEAPARARTQDLATAVFAAFAIAAGVIFIMISPPFWGNDGMSQFGRAYQVSQGDLLPVPIEWGDADGAYGGRIPTTAWHLYEHAVADLQDNPPEPAPLISEPAEYDRLASAPYRTAEKTTVWFTNTAAYSPVPYLPAALGSAIAEAAGMSLGTALTLMALACLLAYVVPVAAGLFALRGSRLQWVVFVVALLPPALLQASTLSADSLTSGLAIAFFAIVAKAALLQRPLARWELVLLAATVVLLPLCKPTYVLLTVLVLFLPSSVFHSRMGAAAAKWVPFGLGVVAWAAWTTVSAPTSSTLAFYRSDYAESRFGLLPQLAWTFAHPVEFLEALARTFFYRDNWYFLDLIGSSGMRVPSLAALLGILALVLAAGTSEALRPSRSQRIALISVAAMSVVAVFATLYASFTPVGYYLVDGIQGRYFFPLLPYIVGALLLLFPLRFAIDDRGAVRVQVAVIAMMGAGLLGTLVKYYFVTWG